MRYRISASLPTRLRVKWPNDVLVDGGKVAGILLESVGRRRRATSTWLVLGIGVNVAHAPADTPIRNHAAGGWLGQCHRGGPPGSPRRALGGMVRPLAGGRLCAGARGLARNGRPAWANRSRCGSSEELLHGRFVALDEDGALMLELPHGERRRMTVGDVLLSPIEGWEDAMLLAIDVRQHQRVVRRLSTAISSAARGASPPIQADGGRVRRLADPAHGAEGVEAQPTSRAPSSPPWCRTRCSI